MLVLGIPEAYGQSRPNEQIDDQVLTLLRSIFPNSMRADIGWRDYATARFIKYADEECDMDPVYQTQDAIYYGVSPDPKFSKVKAWKNAYKVEWKVNFGEVYTKSVILVLKQEGNKWLIDNIIKYNDGKPELMFDYSKPPVPCYG